MFGHRILDATTKWIGFKLIRNCLAVFRLTLYLVGVSGQTRLYRTSARLFDLGYRRLIILPF